MSTFWCHTNDTAAKDNHTLCVNFDDDQATPLGSWEPLFLFYSRNLHVTLSSVICVVGLLGNLLLMTVLLRPNMLSHGGHGAVHVILASIALTDLLTDFTNLIYVMGRSIYSRNDHQDEQNPCGWSRLFFYGYTWNVFVLVHADVSVFLHALSLYLTVVLAYMRVRVIYSGGANAGVRSGGRNVNMTQNEIKSGIWHVIGATIVVAIFCIPNFLRNTIKKIAAEVCPLRGPLQQDDNFSSSHFPDRYKNNSGIDHQVVFYDRYEIVSPDFWDTFHENFTFWVNGITSKIVPCFLLTVFMALLVQVIVTSRKNRRKLIARKTLSPAAAPLPSGFSSSLVTGADRTTVILLSIVFIFWLTELPQGVLLIGSSFDKAVFHAYRLIGDVLDLLSLVNSTVNFMLYCSMSAKFRQEIWRMVLQCVSRGRETTTGTTTRDKKRRSGKRMVFSRGQNGSLSGYNCSDEKSENNTYGEREYVELPVIPERCTEKD